MNANMNVTSSSGALAPTKLQKEGWSISPIVIGFSPTTEYDRFIGWPELLLWCWGAVWRSMRTVPKIYFTSTFHYTRQELQSGLFSLLQYTILCGRFLSATAYSSTTHHHHRVRAKQTSERQAIIKCNPVHEMELKWEMNFPDTTTCVSVETLISSFICYTSIIRCRLGVNLLRALH